MNIKKSKLITNIYILVYCTIMTVVVFSHEPSTTGEWDDYSLPLASFLNDGNATISETDLEYAKELFPEWIKAIDDFELSGFNTSSGDEMPWYFPTYSFLCIPMLILFKLLKISTKYCFGMTNVLCMGVMLWAGTSMLKNSNGKRYLFMICFSIHPIIFYLTWISAETAIFVFLTLSILCWHKGYCKMAAALVSFASSLNVSVLVFGVAMIFDYMFPKIKDQMLKDKKTIKEFLKYLSIYMIALIPFVYNYIKVGKFNLTASTPFLVNGNESTFARVWAYMTDLNFGMLPYFPLTFLLFILLIIPSVVRNNREFCILTLSFIGICFIYSIVVHINNGMSGIARYNAWNSGLFLLAIILYYDQIMSKKLFELFVFALCLLSTLFTGAVIMSYGVNRADRTTATSMTPIARQVLDNVPGLYNPLGSTFHIRNSHNAFEYTFSTPEIYVDDQNTIRKVLLNIDDIDVFFAHINGTKEELKWIRGKLENVSEKNVYISIPKSHTIYYIE